MSRLARGETTKISPRFTPEANRRIRRMSNNMKSSISSIANLILANIFNEMPSKEEMKEIKERIDLTHFESITLTVTKEVAGKISDFAAEYETEKVYFTGFLLSNHLEAMDPNDPVLKETEEEAITTRYLINEDLKKKITEFTTRYNVQMQTLFTWSILHGTKINSFPFITTTKMDYCCVTLPVSIHQKVKAAAAQLAIKEREYFQIALYKMFIEGETL